MSNEEKNMDVEAKSWISMATSTANEMTTWFERDLDDFLREIHQENDGGEYE